jgi:uncharacterized protein (TIGR02421 family)
MAAVTTYKEKIKRLSSRIVDVQRPIRILDAVKWPAYVGAELKKSGYKELPSLTAEDYQKFDLGYDPKIKQEELAEIILDIEATLGRGDAIGNLLTQMTEQYIEVITMLQNRGTKQFWESSRKLYGSPQDKFLETNHTISDLGQMLYSILSKIRLQDLGEISTEQVTAAQAVETLNERFSAYFHDDCVRAKLSDGIIADAAAGGDTVKIRADSSFSPRDVDILEVHEGWVHVGTTQNGNAQHVAKWLSKGPPRCAATQEGLAVIMEIFTFRSYPKRAKQINDRIIGIEKVESGANLLELIEFYRTEGYNEDDCLKNAKRIFRGGTLTGGTPFTKDICYCRGFIENYNFMRSAIRAGRPELVPFLFVGKTHVDDIPLLYQKYEEGIIDPPKYLPAQFKDMNGIAVWMSFSNFLNVVDMKRIQEHYDKLFNLHL